MVPLRFYSLLLLPSLRAFGCAGFFLWFSPGRLMISLLTSFLHFLLPRNFTCAELCLPLSPNLHFLIPQKFFFISFSVQNFIFCFHRTFYFLSLGASHTKLVGARSTMVGTWLFNWEAVGLGFSPLCIRMRSWINPSTNLL